MFYFPGKDGDATVNHSVGPVSIQYSLNYKNFEHGL